MAKEISAQKAIAFELNVEFVSNLVEPEVAKLNKVKEVILANIHYGYCGLFLTPHRTHEEVEVLLQEDGVEVRLHHWYNAFEVIGLRKEDQLDLKRFYYSIKR